MHKKNMSFYLQLVTKSLGKFLSSYLLLSVRFHGFEAIVLNNELGMYPIKF